MHIRVYSVFDVAADSYLQPFLVHTDSVAVRQFEELVNDKEHLFGRHPTDFILFHIGVFDQATGMYAQVGQHIKLAQGHELVADDEPPVTVAEMRQADAVHRAAGGRK